MDPNSLRPDAPMPVRLVSQEEPLPGYRLLERLGRGGFGEVWKAEAPGGLMKAIKFVFGDLDSADEDGRPAEQELKALNRVKSIRHPYILSLERFDIIDGQLIIVMELADRNLWDRFRECRAQGLTGIPRAELMQYMEETAEALDLMNNHYQIQHLDIKPQNLFLVFNHVKIADFGLAKAFEGMKATVTGGVTPVYAAPETFEGWVSRFSDQYSLAIVFQEMLTGTRPINGANTKQLLLAHLNAVPDVAALPVADRPTIARALSKTPDERWPTCMEMVRALKSAGSGAVTGDSAYRTQPNTDTPRPIGQVRTPPKPGSGVSRSATTGSGSFTVTPRSLVTPRLVTQQGNSGAAAAAHTIQRQTVMQTGRMNTLGIAPPERDGDGVLFPAVVVGIGQTGLTVIKKLRQLIGDRFGNPEAIPTLRFLYVDTDPETAAAATSGPDALLPREVVLARLNRPAHYLQQSGNLFDRWMPSGLLYQLPKTPGAANGVRAFGRLALCDNYRLIAQRVRQELETFLTDEPLEKAAEQTGLGLRSNRPRAYIIAGLAGGTGSGMAVDLAYILKHELRGVGYRKPETVGMLFVPPGDKATRQPTALANTFAALSEVRHFTSGIQYQTRFENNEAPITDADGPFSRCVILQLPKVPKERERSRVLGLAARGLFVELLTPAGPATDAVRAALPPANDPNAPVVQAFGLYRLSWPRAQLLAAASRRFSQGLLQRWAGRDSSHLKGPIREWLVDQWDKQKLDVKAILIRLEQAVREELQQAPEALFDGMVSPLRAHGTTRIEADAACEVLEQVVKLVGRPEGEQDTPGSLGLVIHATRQKFLKELETGLATIAVSFIEQPQYRLAGAEEAMTQLAARLTDASRQLESVRLNLLREIRDIVTRLASLLSTSGTANKKLIVNVDVLDAIRAYPTKRLQQAQLDAALAVYRTVLGNLPEYARDVNYCRTRLGELSQTLNGADLLHIAESGLSTLLLPHGCHSLDEVADQFLGALLPEDILVFDQELQTEIKRRLRGVVSVCLKPHRSSDFLALLSARARTFLDERLGHANPAAMFFQQHSDDSEAAKVLTEGYASAAPALNLGESRPLETAILAAPPGLEGERLRQLAADACSGIEFTPAPLTDDLMIYREYPRIELAALPQLDAQARAAYEWALANGSVPHARTDIVWPE